MTKAIMVCAALAFFLPALSADEALPEQTLETSLQDKPESGELDDLFADPDPDVVIEKTDSDHLKKYTEDNKIKFSGFFNTSLGFAFVLKDWSAPKKNSLMGGIAAKTGLTMDIRPNSDLHIRASGSIAIRPTGNEFSFKWIDPSLDELFADYFLAQKVFLRFGNYAVTWGQGRIFTATNLMADVKDGFALRVTVPTWLDGVSALAFAKKSFFTNGFEKAFLHACYAMKLDKILWDTYISFGARYQWHEGISALLSIKRTLWTVDFFVDAAGNYNHNDKKFYARTLAGFFKEWGDIKLYGEYYYDGSLHSPLVPYGGHAVGLALAYNNVGGSPVDMGLHWLHTFVDHSGVVAWGLTWPIWKYINFKAAIPVFYGDNFKFASDGIAAYIGNFVKDPVKFMVMIGLEFHASF